MYFVSIDFSELNRKKNRNREKTEEFVKSFLSSNEYLVKVIDDCGDFNNNNDMRRTIQSCIERNGYNLKVFMSSGVVFLRRM